MQLPKVGDIVEFINKSKEQDRFYLVIKNTYERYYGIVNIATGKRMNWNIGWTDLADDHQDRKSTRLNSSHSSVSRMPSSA